MMTQKEIQEEVRALALPVDIPPTEVNGKKKYLKNILYKHSDHLCQDHKVRVLDNLEVQGWHWF